MEYLDQARVIWQQFVPPSGQADTVQGELLRAVEKLRDEAIRNGNGNWDAGFDMLVDYLGETLPDPQLFTSQQIEDIIAILYRIGDPQAPILDDAPFDMLGDRVCDYYRHYGSRPRDHDPDLRR
jgi:hypothetical protein